MTTTGCYIVSAPCDGRQDPGIPMIHQCYFHDSQRQRLFTSPLYQGFGLYSSVNLNLTENCPELADPQNQQALSEYGAMLHLWRNSHLDPDLGSEQCGSAA